MNIIPSFRRFRWRIRVISLLIICTFLLPNPVLGVSPNVFAMNKSAETEPTSKKSSPTDINDIDISEDIGFIKDSFQGNGDKLIIHIQDAHCNYEAQTNITKIIEILMEKNGLLLVAVEGSAGKIDTSLFNTFPDEEIKREVATYFMKKGKISGAEFIAINTKKPVILYGVENKDHYLENLKAFTTTLPVRGSAKEVCGDIKTYLEKLKNYIYNKELKDLDKKIKDYEENRLKFVDFCTYLNNLAARKQMDLSRYKNFSYFTNALEIEKGINFDKVNNERSELISELEKKLSQDELSDLFMKSLAYKTKKITASEYYTYLKDLAASSRIKLDKFKNLSSYVDYIVTYAKIDNRDLFKELKDLEDGIKDKLYTNDDQRRLNILSRHIRLIGELLDISLSKEDANYLMKNRDKFKSTEFTNFIEHQASRYALAYSPNPGARIIDEVLPTLEKFYQLAAKREDALIGNTLEKMDEEGLRISVLVSGGYHTESLTRLFKDRGISYVVISPRITELDVETPYLKILSGEETPFEEVLSEEEIE